MKIKPDIKDKIIAAANALAGEGNDNPTNDQVRERMGGVPCPISPSDARVARGTQGRCGRCAGNARRPQKAIETSVGQVWTAASKLASMTVDTVRQEAETAITAATDERDEALGEVSRLEAVSVNCSRRWPRRKSPFSRPRRRWTRACAKRQAGQ